MGILDRDPHQADGREGGLYHITMFLLKVGTQRIKKEVRNHTNNTSQRYVLLLFWFMPKDLFSVHIYGCIHTYIFHYINGFLSYILFCDLLFILSNTL